jgi:5-methylcytosine-specific restriction endonuclease McrA
MASDIRLEPSWLTHPKRRMVEARLGPAGLVAVQDLWMVASMVCPDGDLSGKSDLYIESMVYWKGEPGALLDALREAKLVDGRENKSRIHDWADWQPQVCKRQQYSEAGRKAANAKHAKDKQNRQRAERMQAANDLGTHSPDQERVIYRAYGKKCLKCGARKDLTTDHVVPPPAGSNALENLQPLCRACNASKGNQTIDYRPANWAELLQSAYEPHANRMPLPTSQPASQSQSQNQKQVCGKPPVPAQGDAVDLVCDLHPTAGRGPYGGCWECNKLRFAAGGSA